MKYKLETVCPDGSIGKATSWEAPTYDGTYDGNYHTPIYDCEDPSFLSPILIGVFILVIAFFLFKKLKSNPQ